MSLVDYIIAVFTLVDDAMQEVFAGATPWRRRGPQPALSDSEVLAMETIGEFLGHDSDEGIYHYFLWHWMNLFPDLARVKRTDFVKQAARLGPVKERLWRYLLARLPHDPMISIVDSFPLYVCQFARAKRCRLFRDQAAYGHDELIKQTFYGFRWHLRICWPGIISDVVLAPANVHDLDMAECLLENTSGWALGDRNYWSPERQKTLKDRFGIKLLAPPKRRGKDKQAGWTHWMTQKRRRIETVIGQLVGRYHAKRTWARDLWHLLSHTFRKVLGYTVAVFLSLQHGAKPLQFDHLISQ